MREETGGALRPDGSHDRLGVLGEVSYPIVSRRLARNSKEAYESAFRVYIYPALGRQELRTS